MIGHFIGELYRERQKFLNTRLRRLTVSINSTEFTILINLFFRGELHPKDLEQATLVNKSNVTRMIKSLEGKGLVELSPSKEDKRAILVSVPDNRRSFITKELLPITTELDELFQPEQESALQEMVEQLKKGNEDETISSKGKPKT